MGTKKVYFPNLNGLRFFAAFLVIIHHIEQLKSILKIDNYSDIPFVGMIGKLGVVLFFVLSGFLITYLLLVEEKGFKTISIKKFYIRRLLRIWPLYFLIIILALFILPNIEIFSLPGFEKDFVYDNLFLKVIFFALFFPNLVVTVLGIVPYASHTWSIGTEEQFYLVWPVVLKYFKRFRIGLMISIIISYLLISGALSLPFTDFIPYKSSIKLFWSTFKIDCMAIGGFFAVLLFQKHKLLRFLLNEYLFYLVIIFTLTLLIKGVYIPHLHYEFYSILFGIIILNFSANSQIKISLENKLLSYLGSISYGLYMYHPIAIVFTLYIASLLGIYSNWLLYPASLILTVGISGLSYKYFESYFLKFKRKYSKVISGTEAEE